MKTIYKDDKREIKTDGISLDISGKFSLYLGDVKIEKPNKEMCSKLAEIGRNPENEIAIPYGRNQICMPIAVESAIRAALAQFAEDVAEGKRRASLPENVERREIENLINRADRLENSPSEDNVSGPCRMRAEARARLAAWKIRYPEAAKNERKQELECAAKYQESLAAGALTYDCDGSFSREYQEQRSREFLEKAAEYRMEAAKI